MVARAVKKLTYPSTFVKHCVVSTILIFVFAVGLYLGAFLREREDLRNGSTSSVVRMALNLEAIERVRQGRSDEAIGLIDSLNQIELVHLMRNDDLGSTDPEFARRERKVLERLRKIRDDDSGRTAMVEGDAEQREYNKAVDNFLREKLGE